MEDRKNSEIKIDIKGLGKAQILKKTSEFLYLLEKQDISHKTWYVERTLLSTSNFAYSLQPILKDIYGFIEHLFICSSDETISITLKDDSFIDISFRRLTPIECLCECIRMCDYILESNDIWQSEISI